MARLVYDITTRFCDRYISIKSRTHDQMVQAARSGVQNIAEGSQCSGTSKKFELKLTSVARASLEELKLDYEVFLRQRGLKEWGRENPLRQELVDRRFKTVEEIALWVAAVKKRGGLSGQSRLSGQSTESTTSTLSKDPLYSEIAANTALVLIKVTSSLLDRQTASLAKGFEQQCGFTERLYRVRKSSRGY